MQVQPTLEVNKQLAETIISSIGNKEFNLYDDVKKICSSDDVLKNPTDRIITIMIRRGVGRCATEDFAVAYIIERIPGFIDNAGSTDYLRKFAIQRFNGDDKILQVFEKSLASEEFQSDLKNAVACYHQCEKQASAHDWEFPFYDAGKYLRAPLTIYDQAEQLRVYTFPSNFREQ